MKAVSIKDFVSKNGRLTALNTPLQLVKTKVEPFRDGYDGNNKGMEFKTDEIIVLSAYANDSYKKSFYINYVDLLEGAQKAAIVPPDFMIRTPDDAASKIIMKKFTEYQIKNLSSQLGYGWTIGADPEMFVEDENGVVVPSFKFLPSKAKHLKYEGDQSGMLYWDGFQAEFNVYGVGTCMDGLTGYLRWGLKALYEQTIKFNPKAKISVKSVMDIPPEMMKETAPEHAAFGCLPSLNIYGHEGLKADGQDVLYRTAGGHIHFGIGDINKDEDKILHIMKALDAVLGVAAVSLFAKIDEPRRRQMYGLAGEYRLPKHGLEYRTLSNAWLCHPLAANIVFDLGRSALMFGEKKLLKYWKGNSKETAEVINTHDVTKAREILKRNEALFTQIIDARYRNPKATEFVLNAIMNGIESVVKDPSDIKKNWGLGSANEWNNLEGRNVRHRKEGKKV